MNEFIEANRAHKQKGNKMKHQSQNEIGWFVRSQMRGVRIKKPVRIHYRFYEINRRRDKDNISGYFHKVFQDTLVECGILQNDNWDCIDGYRDDFFVDQKRPRIEVEIEEVEEKK